MTLADYLREQGLTARDFASRIGRDPSTVSRLARNQTRPTWDTVTAIQKATEGLVGPNDWAEAA